MTQLALKNELVVDRLASLDVRAGYDTIRAELMDLESQMKQIQDSVETLKRLQQRSYANWPRYKYNAYLNTGNTYVTEMCIDRAATRLCRP